jgi:hypothetical protein
VVLAPWVMRNILFLSALIFNLLGISFQDCLVFQPCYSSFGRNLVRVSHSICECMHVTLGADSDNQSQTSDQP